MVKLIGIMIGAYILTRMIEIGDHNPGRLLTVASILTFLLTAICMLGLLAGGAAAP